MKTGNLYQGIPEILAEEQLQALVESGGVTVERILSKGQSSPVGGWYDQDRAEWVVVLQGEAILHFEEGNRQLHLSAGDHVTIPPHCRHRVSWTPANRITLWLAVFY